MLKNALKAVRNAGNEVLLCWILIGVALYTIAPFLLLAKYNQPSGDDFTLAVRDSRHTLNAVLKDVYHNWSGRFLAPVFSRLNPLLFNPSLFGIYPIILIISFVIAIILVTNELLKERFSFLERLALSSLFIHLIFSQTPSIPEAFYWFSGSCIYQTANIFTLLLIVVLSRLRSARSLSFRSLNVFLAILLCTIIIGSNEVSMGIVLFIVLSAIYNDYKTLAGINYPYIIILFVCLACSTIVFFAPGNFARINDPMFHNKSPLWTIVGAFSVTGLYLLKWAEAVIVSTLVYFVFMFSKTSEDKKCKEVEGNFTFKSFAPSFLLTLIMLQIFIIYLAGGGNLGRVENNIYLFFLIEYFYCLHLVSNKFIHQFNNSKFKRLLTSMSIVLLLLSVLNIENNTSSAYLDLISGRAQRYKYELDQRILLAKNCKSDTCFVPPLPVTPKSLFVTDIRVETDTMFLWINRSYSDFYKTSFLIPTGQLPSIEPNFEIIKRLGKEVRKNMVIKN